VLGDESRRWLFWDASAVAGLSITPDAEVHQALHSRQFSAGVKHIPAVTGTLSSGCSVARRAPSERTCPRPLTPAWRWTKLLAGIAERRLRGNALVGFESRDWLKEG